MTSSLSWLGLFTTDHLPHSLPEYVLNGQQMNMAHFKFVNSSVRCLISGLLSEISSAFTIENDNKKVSVRLISVFTIFAKKD